MQKKDRVETKETAGTKGAADRKEAGHLGVMCQSEGSKTEGEIQPHSTGCARHFLSDFQRLFVDHRGSNQNPGRG